MKQLLILLAIVLFAMTISAETFENERITVKIGDTAELADGKTTIRFIEVVEDSRCPEGTDCIWAGNAKIRIEIAAEGKAEETLELNTNLGETAAYGGHPVKLISLEPHPKEGAEIDRAAYTAIIEFGKVEPCSENT